MTDRPIDTYEPEPARPADGGRATLALHASLSPEEIAALRTVAPYDTIRPRHFAEAGERNDRPVETLAMDPLPWSGTLESLHCRDSIVSVDPGLMATTDARARTACDSDDAPAALPPQDPALPTSEPEPSHPKSTGVSVQNPDSAPSKDESEILEPTMMKSPKLELFDPDDSSSPTMKPAGRGGDSPRDADAAPRRAFPRFPTKESSMGGEADFVLSKIIGKGGQGEVWEGWQSSLAREVAIKRLVTGGLEHFLQEAYAAAALDHPNIVPVHDLGSAMFDGERVPLLAMKRVRGYPWNKVLEEDREKRKAASASSSGDSQPKGVLSLDDFQAKHLRVLLDVCNAVAYAHHKGLIHRDLKPHQVMLGDFGAVYLMDWGLAVHIPGDAPTVGGLPKYPSLATARNRCGTPAYMAPEQTEKKTTNLGFHTDVYLLGAILFEILAGAPPHLAESAESTFVRAMDNEIDPLPEDAPDELRKLALASLDADPKKRPQSVAEFRDALEGYLNGATKRRESRELSHAVAAELKSSKRRGLRSGSAVDYGRYLAMERQLDRALNLWPANPQAEALNLVVVDRHARVALRARDYQLAHALASRLPEHDPKRADLIARATAGLDNRKRIALQRRMALGAVFLLLLALLGLGVKYGMDQARSRERLAEQSARLAEQRDKAENLLGFMLFDINEELSALGRLGLLDRMAAEALKYYGAQDASELDLEATRRRGIALKNIGDVLRQQGHLVEAMKAYERYREIADWLAKREPENPRWRRDQADSHDAVGQTLRQQGNLDAALVAFYQAFEIARAEAERFPDDPEWRALLAGCRVNMGIIQREQGDLDAASEHLAAAGEIHEGLAKIDAKNAKWRESDATALRETGALLASRGDVGGALRAYQAARAQLLGLAAQNPSNVVWQQALSAAHNAIGDILWENGSDLAGAMRSFDAALAIRQRLVAIDPENATWRRDLASSLHDRGRTLLARGDAAAAASAHRESLAILEELASQDRSNAQWRATLARGKDELGRALLAQGDPAAALALHREAIDILDGLAGHDSTNVWWQQLLANARAHAAEALERQGNWVAAAAERGAAISVLRGLAERAPSVPDFASQFWRASSSLNGAMSRYVARKLFAAPEENGEEPEEEAAIAGQVPEGAEQAPAPEPPAPSQPPQQPQEPNSAE